MSGLLLTLTPSLVWSLAKEAAENNRDTRAMNARFGGSSGPEPTERPETEMLQRMAQKDQEAFAQLYDRLSRPLYAVALRILGDAGEAQDIVHDTFIGLWDKAAAFEATRGSAFAWAVALTRNRAIDRLRQRRRRAEILRESATETPGFEPEIGAPAPEAAAQGEDAQAVRAAVATLPVEQKRAVELAFFSGLTQLEIAQRLGEPLGTIKARIRRGLLKLRDTLATRL